MDLQQLWVEPVGSIIIARLRGVPTAAMLQDCQSRVVTLIKDMQHGKVLYDCLEMDTPSIDLVLMQQKFEADLNPLRIRKAIVVPNTKIAYLSRIAFGEGVHRVFYNDMAAAIKWLEE